MRLSDTLFHPMFMLRCCIFPCSGMEGALLSAALSGVGMMMQQSAADDAAKNQQDIINRAAEEEAKINKQKANTIETFAADTFDPTKRDQRYEDAATKQEASLVDALVKASDSGKGDVAQAAEGNLSSDYARAKATQTANAAEDIRKRANLMARNAASSLMYNDESLKGGQLTSDLAGLGYDANRVRRSANTQLGRAQNNGSLVGGLMAGFAPAAGKYIDSKAAEWDSAWGG